jgi:hypothetical protein
MPRITLQSATTDIRRKVKVTQQHGGHRVGKCDACGAQGWIIGSCGLPNRVAEEPPALLRHKRDCPLNPRLTNHGRVIRKNAARPKKRSSAKMRAKLPRKKR